MRGRRPVTDADVCAAVTRAHARTFALASGFLPAHKRRAAFAVYAFCRLADDIVDQAGTLPVEVVTRQLDRFRRGLDEALAGQPSGPVFREVHRVAERFAVPRETLVELLDGVARDLAPTRYATWADLTAYCEGVASSVGSMCTYVFEVAPDAGPDGRERALRFARILGVAMQVTNILRDVGEDAARGRCYLPEQDLAMFGLTADRVLQDPRLRTDPRWAEFMRPQVARARALYAAAAPGIALLAPDARRCARACADGYAAILGAIERNGYDNFSHRARVGAFARAGLLASLVLGPGRLAVPAAAPAIAWGAQVFTRPEDLVLCR